MGGYYNDNFNYLHDFRVLGGWSNDLCNYSSNLHWNYFHGKENRAWAFLRLDFDSNSHIKVIFWKKVITSSFLKTRKRCQTAFLLSDIVKSKELKK